MWLTLLTAAPPLEQYQRKLGEASFKVLKVPVSLPSGAFHVQCEICGHQIRAALISVNSMEGEDGQQTIRYLFPKVHETPHSRNTESVEEHLLETKYVVQSDEPLIQECDCEFRFHQVMANGHFLWYADGRGFADDVSTWLEFDEDPT